jgi:hypothetical protein
LATFECQNPVIRSCQVGFRFQVATHLEWRKGASNIYLIEYRSWKNEKKSSLKALRSWKADNELFLFLLWPAVHSSVFDCVQSGMHWTDHRHTFYKYEWKKRAGTSAGMRNSAFRWSFSDRIVSDTFMHQLNEIREIAHLSWSNIVLTDITRFINYKQFKCTGTTSLNYPDWARTLHSIAGSFLHMNVDIVASCRDCRGTNFSVRWNAVAISYGLQWPQMPM